MICVIVIEKELREAINVLELKIYCRGNSLKFTIYSKLTETDIIICNKSCHPYGNKLSGINYLLSRLLACPVTRRAKEAEISTTINILQNNECKINFIGTAPLPVKQNVHTDP
jgi:hypothetical protein